jgi:hypothetical protein
MVKFRKKNAGKNLKKKLSVSGLECAKSWENANDFRH